MISRDEDPVAWALLLMDLEEVHEHLGELIQTMDAEGRVDETNFAAALGHLYAHLNRVWHGRAGETPMGDDEWSAASAFPDDIEPVG